jgi:putative ABC transport system substrate-binding protein
VKLRQAHDKSRKQRSRSKTTRGKQNAVTFFVFVCLLTAVLLPAHSEAQQTNKARRIGFLCPAKCGQVEHDGLRDGLRELGYVEGRDVVIMHRSADSNRERLRALAADLVGMKVDVIVTASTPAISAAKESTRTIPIVFASAGDPVGSGLVASLAKPGGNITGVTILSPELSGKRLELLKETVPQLSRIAVLSNPATPAQASLGEFDTTARALGLTLKFYKAQRLSELQNAFSSIAHDRLGALVIVPDAFFASQRSRFIEFTISNRLPAIFDRADYANDGGLMSYGIDFRDQFRRAAYFVDKIFKGANPSDLPVEQPKKFEFVINLKTAKQIGLIIPPNVLARADRVIK